MKRNFIIILIAVLTLGLGSCTDWLDTRPVSEIVLDDYWQSEAQAQAVLMACYRGLITDGVMERMLIWGELRSDNFTAGTGFPNERIDMSKILEVNITPTNSYCAWAPFYSVINNCNTFLHYAPGVVDADQNFTEGKLHSLEAEVRAIRALCYFYLVRTYKEVPWVGNPSISDTQDYKMFKSSERAVLDSIIADLTIARKYARIDFGTVAQNKGRITRNAVNAILADVYLWDQQYDKCVEMCNEVLADQSLGLVPGETMFENVFYRGNSIESIFELQFDENVQRNNTTRNLYGIQGDIQGELSFPLYLIKGEYSPFKYKIGTDVESEKDLRFKDFIVQNMGEVTGIYSVFKYAGIMRTENQQELSTYSWRSTTPNWIVYRVSDVLLMKAEALVAPANPSESAMLEALLLVNVTYQRSNPTSTGLDFAVYNTKGILEKLILRERQRELMFEGKRWFDLMRVARRNNSPTSLLTYLPQLTGLQFNKMSVMDALYLPVPQSDMDNNENMVQNPFYEEYNTSK